MKELGPNTSVQERLEVLDQADYGETIFIEDLNKQNIQYLYVAMLRKKKRFSQIRQAIGYTMVRKEDKL